MHLASKVCAPGGVFKTQKREPVRALYGASPCVCNYGAKMRRRKHSAGTFKETNGGGTVKVTDEAIRIIGRRRWNPDRCKPLTALMWLLGALATVPVWLWLAKGVMR